MFLNSNIPWLFNTQYKFAQFSWCQCVANYLPAFLITHSIYIHMLFIIIHRFLSAMGPISICFSLTSTIPNYHSWCQYVSHYHQPFLIAQGTSGPWYPRSSSGSFVSCCFVFLSSHYSHTLSCKYIFILHTIHQ